MEEIVTKENFDEVTKTEKLVVLDFWAEWCGPCRMIGPIMEEIAEQEKERVVVGKCNVDKASELSAFFGIRSIPTVIFIKNGKVVDKIIGATSKQNYLDKINAHLVEA